MPIPRITGRSLNRLTVLMFCLSPSVGQAQLVGLEEDTGNLYRVSATDASLTLIGGTGVSNMGALEFNPYDGLLYGMTAGVDSALYRIAISPTWDSVSVDLVGQLGFQTFEGGLAFSPDGRAFALNGGATIMALLELNLDTGAASVLAIRDGRHDIAGLGWRDDGLLVGLDSTTGALLEIDPVTGETTHIEDIAATVGSLGGMVMAQGEAYFATAGPLAPSWGSNELFSFDPYTGVHHRIGSFDPTLDRNGISGLAIVPEPTTLGLLALGCLALIRRPRSLGLSMR